MSLGKVMQLGTPVEIYERPQNRFVADFIGESNFFEGQIKSLAKDEAVVYVPSLNCEITGLPVGNSLVSGEQAVVSVRPEKVRITDHAGGHNTFTGRVATSVYIGSNTHLIVDVGDVRVKVWEQNRISRLDPKSYYTVGQDVNLVLMPENTLVMPKG
jgi:spermidine/putrescine transport system ATP-binding protein